MPESILPNSKRRVAIYIRVSTSEQEVDGYSLSAQKTRLLKYIEENKGLDLVTEEAWVYSDTHSGNTYNRPELQRLLADLKKGKFDAVLVWKIDRLSRSLKHLLTVFDVMEENHVSFISLQENIDFRGPIGKLIFQIFGAIAQFERELIKTRTRMGKIASAELGNYTGSVIPYGYEPVPNPNGNGKRLALLPEEHQWVQKIYDWYLHQNMGFGQICKKLNQLKVPKGKHRRQKSNATRWTQKQVRSILTNELYRGSYVANKRDDQGNILPDSQWTVVEIPPSVSELLFRQVQCAREQRESGEHFSGRYLLSGKIMDMSLPNPKRFSGCNRNRGGYSYRRTQFTDSAGTYHPVFEVSGKALDDCVWNKVVRALSEPEVFVEEYLEHQNLLHDQIEDLEIELNRLRQAQTFCKDVEIPRIKTAYERELYEIDELQKRLTEKNEELNKFHEQIRTLEEQIEMASLRSQEITALQNTARQIQFKLDDLPQEQKASLCQLFVKKVELTRERLPHGKGWDIQAEIFYRFNPERACTKNTINRTSSAHREAKKEGSGVESALSGDCGKKTYHLFSFKIKYTKDGRLTFFEDFPRKQSKQI